MFDYICVHNNRNCHLHSKSLRAGKPLHSDGSGQQSVRETRSLTVQSDGALVDHKTHTHREFKTFFRSISFLILSANNY